MRQVGVVVKSLLISSQYFHPHTGGISRMMQEICLALGSDCVSCLTGVCGTQRSLGPLGRTKEYRRPKAFHHNRYVPALSFACLISEILVRDCPQDFRSWPRWVTRS